ncbi:MAG: hypothetical protein LUH47_10670 [Clostridiales bacterium]|nr:hypothetical protein [Clostridiales bacterium]
MMLINAVLCTYAGKTDMHFVITGIWQINIILAFTGTIGVICFALLLKNDVMVKFHINSAMSFLGYNSLFIMVTHEYFPIKSAISFCIDKLFAIQYGTVLHAIIQTCILIAIEVVLSIILGKKFNSCIKYVSYKINKVLINI